MLRGLRIGTRLNIVFGVLLALFLSLAIFMLHEIGNISGLIRTLYERPYTASSSVRDANTNLVKVQRNIREMILTHNPAEIEEAADGMAAARDAVSANLSKAKNAWTGDSSDLDKVISDFGALPPLWAEEARLCRANQNAQAYAMVRGQSRPISTKLDHDMASLVADATQDAVDLNNNAADIARNAYKISIVLLVLCIVLAFLSAYVITQSIVRPLASAVEVATMVAAGDLSVSVPMDKNKDEVGALIQALNDMVIGLRGQIREILEGIAVLTSSASELAATSTQFASTSTETAASVTETTATVEEVKQTSRVASEKAQDVADRAHITVQISQQGQDSVNATIGGIQHIRQQMTFIADSVVRLSEQNQAISDIISSVDDLAEQSNLLAVNASIEAAKAGEHGKGFAVVAREVKSLAEQSRQATRQVRGILSEIQKATSATVMATEQGSKSVDMGVSQASEVGEALRTLGQSVGDWAMMAQQIVSTTHQQYIGIDQVTLAMESIKMASGQNVDGARQLEAASRNLDDLGKRLHNVVTRYKV